MKVREIARMLSASSFATGTSGIGTSTATSLRSLKLSSFPGFLDGRPPDPSASRSLSAQTFCARQTDPIAEANRADLALSRGLRIRDLGGRILTGVLIFLTAASVTSCGGHEKPKVSTATIETELPTKIEHAVDDPSIHVDGAQCARTDIAHAHCVVAVRDDQGPQDFSVSVDIDNDTGRYVWKLDPGQ